MHSHIRFQKETTVAGMLPYYSLITLLTPALTADEYSRLLQQMVPHNYYQVAAYEGDTCVGVSGYWIGAKLYCGKYLEIDNFVVAESHRSRGLGKLFIDWLEAEARANECSTLMLDAYIENFSAHRFYYREGFIGRGFHYLKKLR